MCVCYYIALGGSAIVAEGHDRLRERERERERERDSDRKRSGGRGRSWVGEFFHRKK